MAAERNPWSELNPEFLVNEKGERTKVLLDYQEFLDLLEEIEFQADVAWAEEVLKKKLESKSESRPWREIRDEIEAKHTAK
jgi:hypothetical protein